MKRQLEQELSPLLVLFSDIGELRASVEGLNFFSLFKIEATDLGEAFTEMEVFSVLRDLNGIRLLARTDLSGIRLLARTA